jgi:hypothetical protein
MRSAMVQILVINVAGMEQVFHFGRDDMTRSAEWSFEWLWLVSTKWPWSNEVKMSGTNWTMEA